MSKDVPISSTPPIPLPSVRSAVSQPFTTTHAQLTASISSILHDNGPPAPASSPNGPTPPLLAPAVSTSVTASNSGTSSGFASHLHTRQGTMSSTSAYAPPFSMNQITMPYIKRHAVKRVKAAKDACNNELQKVIHSITLYFEERLGEREREEAEEQYHKAQLHQQQMRELHLQQERGYQQRQQQQQHEQQPIALHHPEASANVAELYAAIQELNKVNRDLDKPNRDQFEGEEHGSAPLSRSNSVRTEPVVFSHSRQASNSSSPLRKQLTLPPAKLPISHSSPVPIPGDTSPRSKSSTQSAPPSSWAGSQGTSASTPASRRLSRAVHSHMVPPASHSTQSSRSTSRSRSPMPFSTAQNTPSLSEPIPRGESSSSPRNPNGRLSRHLDSTDAPVDPFMSTLHDLIAVCTDITEMSSSALTSRPGMGSDLVRKVQEVGRAWEDNLDWHGRTWYVTVLLAVASLSRVVEWFEAERQFWNFEDKDDEEVEPLQFVLRPEYEEENGPETVLRSPAATKFEDDNLLRLTRPEIVERLSRDERVPQKDLRGPSLGLLQQPQQQQQRKEERVEPSQVVVETKRAQDAEDLRLMADKAKTSNILMELNLDGEHFLYINRTWFDVIGSNPDTLVNMGLGISELLHPGDSRKFKEASERLQSDDSHTVEIQFRIRVESGEESHGRQGPNVPVYKNMEGSGMLMLDRVDHIPSHTMWVIKPAPVPEVLYPEEEEEEEEEEVVVFKRAGGVLNAVPQHHRRLTDAVPPSTPFPVFKTMSATPILCRICENQIPSWFFEKHNETCSDVHKFEADAAECNDGIVELRNTIRGLIEGIDKPVPSANLEYRGILLFSPGATPNSSSPITVFRPPLASRVGRVGVRKAQRGVLEQVDEILQVAREISMPALCEEEAKEPIERQRLLSPASEDRIGLVRDWQKPLAEDPALSRLVQDAELLMRTKLDTVTRMQNTVRYSEKIRQEWEERYEMAVAQLADDPQALLEEEAIALDSDDAASTTSEYDFGREPFTSEPTPVAASPMPTPVIPIVSPMPVSVTPTPTPPVHRAAYQGSSRPGYSRPSTPNSVTSPLALAAPIIASSPGTTPPALLCGVEGSAHTIHARRSAQNLMSTSPSEPRLFVTPPVSPLILPRDSETNLTAPANKAHLRRLSTIRPILSPTTAVTPGPLSPRLPSMAPASKSAPSSIKDFDIIKPVSKGAFGSVFLAKKKTTGDYYAIKVLKKADMIAKNQITNVKAERMILMKQAESPFVVKLYFTFQSKENLYLVMEYLNGGDCAALIKTLGALPEEWTRAYVAEIVLALEYLHERGIVHRDLKPDNLLIDQHGHLKLTDFGLSRIGLLGRQTRDTRRLPERLLGTKPGRGRRSPGSRPTSFDSTFLASPLLSAELQATGSYFNPRNGTTAHHIPFDDMSESSGSESVSHLLSRRSKVVSSESPLQSFAADLTNELRSHTTTIPTGISAIGGTTSPGEQKFVGTPDYLAPETILGSSADDRTVDWWALGVVTYEFLYGIPPFHAETPDKVFERILSMKIEWHEEWIDFSAEARNFMERLLTYEPRKRLGFHGAKEVKEHTFLSEIEWDKVMDAEPAFVPKVEDPESTDYFDPRGAIPQLFHDDELVAVGRPPSEASQPSQPSHHLESSPGANAQRISSRDTISTPSDDFGTFNFKNLSLLKQANDDVIKKMKSDQMVQTLGDPLIMHHRKRSLSQRIKKPTCVSTNFEPRQYGSTNPPSPTTSTSSIASSPSRASMGPSTPGSIQSHLRRPSEYSAIDRFKANHLEGEIRRNSMPSRLRTASVSSADAELAYSGSDPWPHSSTSPAPQEIPKRSHDIGGVDRAVVCLIAEDNPISAKILETLLVRLGCRCVIACDGAEAISTAHGDIKFDCILMDYHMPVVDGESAARYIKSTNNLNRSTPIIAVSAYVGQDSAVASNLFAACLPKPVHKAHLLNVLKQLGFRTSTTDGHGARQVAKVAVS